MHIDVDEFIVLLKHTSVIDVAREYIPESGGLSVQWLSFGHSDELAYRDAPVLTRFTRCRQRLSPVVKTMFVAATTRVAHVHSVGRFTSRRFAQRTAEGIAVHRGNDRPDAGRGALHYTHISSLSLTFFIIVSFV